MLQSYFAQGFTWDATSFDQKSKEFNDMLYCFYRKECLDQNMKQMDQFHRALLIRNLMIMLLTDRGHDVAVFDPDAFILQDPMDMYQKIVQEAHAHVIGQRGSMPVRFTKLWGFTLCAGAMFYHSSTTLSKLAS